MSAAYRPSMDSGQMTALRRYTQRDFIALVDRHRVPWHEKTLGQLFCDDSSRRIIDLLVHELRDAGADLRLGTAVEAIEPQSDGFQIRLSNGTIHTAALVIATGGKSIPKMGASGFGYRIAEQFGLPVTDTRPALVPFVFDPETRGRLASLSGVSVPARVSAGGTAFDEGLLFTHRGLSGPAVLQASSYWREGEPLTVGLMPDLDIAAWLKLRRSSDGAKQLATVLAEHLPKRLVGMLLERLGLSGKLAELSTKRLEALAAMLSGWEHRPAGTEGYRTAEVTLGGVCTDALDPETMMVRQVPGLYFIGEVADVTGWLGGYNFQWAWSSGWVAGTAIAAGARGRA